MSLEVIRPLGDDEVKSGLMTHIEGWHQKLCATLPELPRNLQIYFVDQDDPLMIEEWGVGGYAYSPEIMSLAYRLDYDDKDAQLKYLQSTHAHEGLHISQGYTGATRVPLLDACVYEGLAKIFEVEFTGLTHAQVQYPEDESVINSWIEQIKTISDTFTYEEYLAWAFGEDETGEKFRLYKAGAWIIDQILIKNKDTSVMALTRMNAPDILALSSV